MTEEEKKENPNAIPADDHPEHLVATHSKKF